ncbi:Methanogen homoaconitase large subunit [Frankliniella fusca]|uniref:Methanogen homoaconitase large subunit n=1 Tax=Frankliniella fusca TaxID=407009 RepID=A0AAE1I1P6_9NEOP|nr:Methanogen homoaconitase large subunit [Frankliniella fusca]KAK3930690.1 Methanogen homoaconitase large subunit [Frankliniella fusca]
MLRSPLKNITNQQANQNVETKPTKNLHIVRRFVPIPLTVKKSLNVEPTPPTNSSVRQQCFHLPQSQISFDFRPCLPRQDSTLLKVREVFKEIQNRTPELLSVSTGAAHSNSFNDKLSDRAHPISPEENLSETLPVNKSVEPNTVDVLSVKDSSARELHKQLLLESNDSDSFDLSDEDFIVPKKKKSLASCSLTDTFTKEIPSRKKANCRKSNDEREKIIASLEEKSKCDKNFQRIHEYLPQTFDYIITSLEEKDLEWKALVRANINTKEEVELWLEEYQFLSSCDYRIRDNRKENNRHVWKKIYRCHFKVPQPKTQHTSKRKIERPSKNIDCPANMRISIKNKDMKWSGDDLLQKYPCEIMINHSHNHYVDSKEALRRRRPPTEIVQKFSEMFQNGHHSPSSAVATHKMNLQTELGDNYFLTAADRSKCPDVKWASRLYYKIFKKFYGAADGEEMLKSLEDYIKKYNDKQESVCAAYQTLDDKDIIIAVCTPLMKRVHEKLRSAGEVTFVDSSGTMDRQNHRVFLVLCPSIAGGLPLGVIITSSEAEEVLKKGFSLLNSLVPDSKAFGGRGLRGPKIIFTDDSDAERNALQFTFSEAVLLLCIFHVLQAFWRYVWNADHKVDKKFRAEVYHAFHDAVYAENAESFENHFKELLGMPAVTGNDILLKHLRDYKVRAKEWAICFRSDLLTRGHTTNNYAEAGMLQLKSTILQRTKAFNLVQLLDFIVAGFMGHLERRLVDVINDRALNVQRSRYFVEPEKLKPLRCSKLTIPNFYLVKNESKGTEYVVNMKEEVCSCPVGVCGATCKHQCAVVKEFNLSSSQILNFVDVTFKQDLLYIVYGSHITVPSHWFAKLTDKPTSQQKETSEVVSSEIEDSSIIDPTANEVEISQVEASCSNAVESFSLAEIDKIATGLHEMVNGWVSQLKSRPEVYGKACEAIIKQSNVMSKRDSELTSAMFMFGKAQGTKALDSIRSLAAKGILGRALKHSRKIPVNATSRSRRTTYLGGRNVQITGRPPNAVHHRVSEHNFCTPVASKIKAPAWDRLPKGSTAAPHSLDFCVSRRRNLGRTHHKK